MSDQLVVSVLGAGSFGTALSAVLLDCGHDVSLWCFEDGHAAEIREAGRNTRYMKDFPLPGIRPTASLETSLRGADLVLFVSPSHVTRGIARAARGFVGEGATVVCAAKGIEEGSGKTMADVLLDELPECAARLAVLSGPSFAFEVLKRQPTAVVVAAQEEAVAERVQRAFATPHFRVYRATDIVGIELGGAVKNVIAIATGLCDGLGFGHNARAALITRGLAEMSRLGAALGADPLTFMGLAGMGDLVLTCTGDLSRNRTVGIRLASGMTLEEVTASLGGQVAEGVKTCASTRELARRIGVDMPIVEAIWRILYDGKDPRGTVSVLMGRPLKAERS
jgi:glycerol-3-phosphate dehydrogenase (NAD(P)+)